MTPQEHYELAEQILEKTTDGGDVLEFVKAAVAERKVTAQNGVTVLDHLVAVAQVHATLSLFRPAEPELTLAVDLPEVGRRFRATGNIT